MSDNVIIKNFVLTLTSRRELQEKEDKALYENPSQPLYVTISKKPKKRGLPANAQQHVFYEQISQNTSDQDPLDVKNFCKLTFGLPIMLASDQHEPLVSFLIDRLDYNKYSYESKLKLMKVIVHTSEFSTKESKRYMDQMIRFYNDQGIMIKYKD